MAPKASRGTKSKPWHRTTDYRLPTTGYGCLLLQRLSLLKEFRGAEHGLQVPTCRDGTKSKPWHRTTDYRLRLPVDGVVRCGNNRVMAQVVFILGCTGVGKGVVARVLAGQVGGQIVCVDSMKIYRRMDIGTAKPSPAARAQVPHHCIDLVEPGESFSVAQYVAAADEAIASIFAAGDVPLAVGGTSLYIKALSEGLFAGPPADEAFRAALKSRAQREGVAALHAELVGVDPAAADRIHPHDERRIVRALEVYRATGARISDLQEQWDTGRRRYDCVFFGLRRSREDLHRRINARVKRMLAEGLRDEVASLLAEPVGLSAQASRAVGYAEIIDHLRGRCTLSESAEQIKIHTRRLAKKQRTWYRRWPDVRWVDAAPDETPEAIVGAILARTGLDDRSTP